MNTMSAITRWPYPRLILAGLILASVSGLATAEDKKLDSGIDPDGFDLAVRPQDDLFLHVNGRWLLTTEIPSDKSNYGSFTALDDAARENIRAIIEESVKNPTDENSHKVGDFYRSFMNEEVIAEKGIQPLQSQLDAINALATTEDVVRFFGKVNIIGIGSPFGFGIGTDDKNSSRYLSAVSQGGTTLPDRDYYLEKGEKYAEARFALQAYIVKLFNLAELPDGYSAAEDILKLETALAKVQWSRTELRDAEKRYNLYEVTKLTDVSSRLPWATFFEAVGVPDLKEVNVITPSFFTALETIVAETPVETWKQYCRFRVLDSAAEYLTPEFVNAHFELHDRTITGVPEQKPRWKQAVDATSGAGAGDFGVLGESLGQLYVQKHFPAESRRRMDELVANLMKTYEASIHELTWMTDATKSKALDKLHKITTKIGYPDEWRDYSKLEIKADDLIGNMRRSAQFEHFRQLDRLYKPVDRNEWGMTPQTVNAYYNPSMNEIVFPAAILQPPFFDALADDAANYGGIGAVIGHEISHGFDDEGSKYDGDGNLENWWTEADREAFEKLTGRLVTQFEGYEPLPGRKLNGKLTLGENIADLSGMAIAYKAYRMSLVGKDGPVIDGHTAAQRFFLSWAQIWRRKYREDELIRRLVIDPHSPSSFRANGPISNLDAFYEAFDVKPGDNLFRAKADRIQIW
jgi:putative endopeptidase